LGGGVNNIDWKGMKTGRGKMNLRGAFLMRSSGKTRRKQKEYKAYTARPGNGGEGANANIGAVQNGKVNCQKRAVLDAKNYKTGYISKFTGQIGEGGSITS